MTSEQGNGERSPGLRRLALLTFGALFLALFLGFAIAQGIGQPSVPSGEVAIVEDVADVSKEEFDRALAQQVAQAKLKKTPEAGSDKFEELKAAAMGELLDQIWIQGQAEELDLTVTDKQVEDELESIKKQNFGSDEGFEKFLKESKFTREDVDDRVRLQLLSTQIQEKVSGEAPKPSSEEVQAYYEAEKATQLTLEERRDVRVIVNRDKSKIEMAKTVLEKDDSPTSWEKAAQKYSTDSAGSTKGGLQRGVTEEFLKEPIKAAVFESSIGELSGPVKFQGNWILVEVVRLTPEKVQPLAEVRPQIESALARKRQQEFFDEFVSGYEEKWRGRTVCADGYAIEQCLNFKGDGRPEGASPACYEEDPETPPASCPAPVFQLAPALPGTISLFEPKGEALPQRPVPLPEGSAGTPEETLIP